MKNSAAIWFAKMKTKDGPAFSEHLLDCKVWNIVGYIIDVFFLFSDHEVRPINDMFQPHNHICLVVSLVVMQIVFFL
jgi:hypothetical protein